MPGAVNYYGVGNGGDILASTLKYQSLIMKFRMGLPSSKLGTILS